MGGFPREEIEAAFENYNRARIQASTSGDWRIWAAVFTEDAHYTEHAYGEMHGRQEIEDWITKVMAPFPHMSFPQDWVAFDDEHDAVVFQCQNRLEHPGDPDGEPFQFPSWTRLVYGGNGLWKSEEDVYNPARDAGRTISAWRKAGGEFESRELVQMTDR
ncbi:MAG: nuclear transport factor 2 family protein [bacterium]|nr:nuclear transport factor 2 family protein [bacterium]